MNSRTNGPDRVTGWSDPAIAFELRAWIWINDSISALYELHLYESLNIGLMKR